MHIYKICVAGAFLLLVAIIFICCFYGSMGLQCSFCINMQSVCFFILSDCYKTCSMGYGLCIFMKNESKFVGN